MSGDNTYNNNYHSTSNFDCAPPYLYGCEGDQTDHVNRFSKITLKKTINVTYNKPQNIEKGSTLTFTLPQINKSGWNFNGNLDRNELTFADNNNCLFGVSDYNRGCWFQNYTDQNQIKLKIRELSNSDIVSWWPVTLTHTLSNDFIELKDSQGRLLKNYSQTESIKIPDSIPYNWNCGLNLEGGVGDNVSGSCDDIFGISHIVSCTISTDQANNINNFLKYIFQTSYAVVDTNRNLGLTCYASGSGTANYKLPENATYTLVYHFDGLKSNDNSFNFKFKKCIWIFGECTSPIESNNYSVPYNIYLKPTNTLSKEFYLSKPNTAPQLFVR